MGMDLRVPFPWTSITLGTFREFSYLKPLCGLYPDPSPLCKDTLDVAVW